jgi:NAD(P)-dependent dehydrogenase (short-subunit alcohol dehydrogenase family)
MDLKGRLALVTGAAHRVGRSIALELARAGADIVVHYHRSAEPAQATAAEIAALGRRAFPLAADLADVTAIMGLFERVAAEAGPLDVLVNSAAIFPRGPVAEVTPEQWDMVMAVNVRAPFFCAQQAAAAMRGRGGAIVNIADVGGEVPWAGYVPYGVSKAGVIMMTRGLAVALAPDVRVNAVAPGPVLLPDGWSEELARRSTARTLLRRVGTPEDVSRAVRFLLESDYITGETLFVDGGRRWG